MKFIQEKQKKNFNLLFLKCVDRHKKTEKAKERKKWTNSIKSN